MGNERVSWEVLGRIIGTGTGWDQSDDHAFCIYDFEPVEGIDLIATDCLNVDTVKGWFEFEVGEGTARHDIIGTLRNIPRTEGA